MNAPAPEREGLAALLLRMRAKGISAKALVGAVEQVPRRDFVPVKWQAAVWSDRMIPIECGEAMEGVDLQVQMINALGVEDHHKVLEIGSGSGYTAALLSRLAARVFAVDRYKTLTGLARQRIEALGIANVVARHADASKGLHGEGPFDRIISWASFESLPRSFVDQLSTGGIMIAPIGPPDAIQAVARLTKVGSRFEREDIGRVRLQPLVHGLAVVI